MIGLSLYPILPIVMASMEMTPPVIESTTMAKPKPKPIPPPPGLNGDDSTED